MRLATLNVMHGRSTLDGRVDVERFRAAVSTLDADVLALQEVDRAQPRSHLADLAREAADATGCRFRFVPALRGTPGERWRSGREEPSGPRASGPEYGIALLSRLPVDRWWVRWFAAAPVRSPLLLPRPRRRVGFFRDEPRALLAAAVRTPAGPLTVATTHLSFVPGWNVLQLTRACRALRALPAPRILLGDLNLPANLPALVSGWHRLARADTYPARNPRVQIDHVLADGPVPPALRCHTVATAVSDHRALVVELADG